MQEKFKILSENNGISANKKIVLNTSIIGSIIILSVSIFVGFFN